MRHLLFYLLLFAVTACSNRSGIPKGIIPPDSMQKIMKDVVMADQYSIQYISRDSLKQDKLKANQDLYEIIFKLHHITRAEFKTSLEFYDSRPDMIKKIFDSLAADGNRYRMEYEAPKILRKQANTAVK